MRLPTWRGDGRHARTDGPLDPDNRAQRRSGELSTVAATGRRDPRVFEAVGGMGGAALAPPIY